MYKTFISIIGIVTSDPSVLKSVLSRTHKILRDNFQDFEIVLVNNHVPFDISDALKDMEEVCAHTRILNLSKSIDSNNAIVAGLDHANGDYVIVMDMDISTFPDLIVKLYKKSQENNDVVYVRLRERKMSALKMILFKLFYKIMKSCSDIEIDFNMSDIRIVSRRALNSILRVRDKLRYTKGIYSFVGYKTSFIEEDLAEESHSKKTASYSELLFTAISAITSFTDIGNKLLLYIFSASFLFCVGAGINALCVKFIGFDIFGNPAPHVQGFTFLIVFLSITFSINYFILYVFSIYLFSINREIKDRPIYILESIQKLQDNKFLRGSEGKNGSGEP